MGILSSVISPDDRPERTRHRGVGCAMACKDIFVTHPRDGATWNCIHEYKRTRVRASLALIEYCKSEDSKSYLTNILPAGSSSPVCPSEARLVLTISSRSPFQSLITTVAILRCRPMSRGDSKLVDLLAHYVLRFWSSISATKEGCSTAAGSIR